MRKAYIGHLLLGSLLFVSCRNSARESTSYFDSLVVAQVNLLSAARARIVKVASINREEDQSKFTPSQMQWENELGAFRQLGIFEKSTYHNAYEIHDSISDPKSNLLIKSYRATRKVPVMELKFYYRDRIQNLIRIEATYVEENALYSTRRRMSMEFDEVKGKPLLSNYSILGDQKMILSKTVLFSVKSNVSL